MVKLDARISLNRDALVKYLAEENIVPVKSPPWSKYRYTLRRMDKGKRGLVGIHFAGIEMTAELLKILNVYDDDCRKVREEIKQRRKSLGLDG